MKVDIQQGGIGIEAVYCRKSVFDRGVRPVRFISPFSEHEDEVGADDSVVFDNKNFHLDKVPQTAKNAGSLNP